MDEVSLLCAGDALHVTPILHRGQNSTVAYFPAGLWYNLYNYTLIDTTDGGKNVTVEVRFYHPPGIDFQSLDATSGALHFLRGKWLVVGLDGSSDIFHFPRHPERISVLASLL